MSYECKIRCLADGDNLGPFESESREHARLGSYMLIVGHAAPTSGRLAVAVHEQSCVAAANWLLAAERRIEEFGYAPRREQWCVVLPWSAEAEAAADHDEAVSTYERLPGDCQVLAEWRESTYSEIGVVS